MIQISFWTGEAVFTAIWILIRVIVWIVRGRIDLKREAVLLIMYVNLAVIIRFTFYPLETVDGHIQPLLFDPSQIYPFHINPVPFSNLNVYADKKSMWTEIIGNIALFIPSGIVIPIVYKKLNSLWKTLALGAGISLSIELIQLFFYTRTTDTNDFIFNTFGVFIGYCIYALVKRLFKRKEVKDA